MYFWGRQRKVGALNSFLQVRDFACRNRVSFYSKLIFRLLHLQLNLILLQLGSFYIGFVVYG